MFTLYLHEFLLLVFVVLVLFTVYIFCILSFDLWLNVILNWYIDYNYSEFAILYTVAEKGYSPRLPQN